jgi:DNA-binding SARP family transcriptional activator
MMRIRLIGEMALEIDGTSAPAPASRRARSLLAWLALHPGPHPRAEVAARFWPDVLDSSARTNLRSALLTLRNSGRQGRGTS